MKVLGRDERTGEVTLMPETLDDLWHLVQLISPGDLVRATTLRRLPEQDDRIRSQRAEKRPVTLGIRVKDVEYQDFGDRLRILGAIEEGPDTGQHHSLGIEARSELTIVKERWRTHELQRIDEAVKASRRPLLAIVAIDEGEALVGILHHFGVREAGVIRGPGTGKHAAQDPAANERFFASVRQALDAALPGAGPVVVIGPGFARESFVRYLHEKAGELAARTVTEGTAHSGMTGVHEALRRGIVERIDSQARVAVETRLVEAVLQGIAKGRGVAYGSGEVERALSLGAARDLLVTDKLVREGPGPGFVARAEATRCAFHVISTTHEAGRRLQALGGAACLLRFEGGG